jgi:hypothetical protein
MREVMKVQVVLKVTVVYQDESSIAFHHEIAAFALINLEETSIIWVIGY